MKRRSVVLIVLLLTVSLVAALPGNLTMPTPAQAAGEGHFAIAPGSIDHLDPALWYFALTWRLGYALCTPLVTFPDAEGEAGKQVVGGLADLPEVSADGLTYTFTLKPGIKFADGKSITGEDIKATFERLFTPRWPRRRPGSSPISSARRISPPAKRRTSRASPWPTTRSLSS